MNVSYLLNGEPAILYIPLNFIFWGFVAAYVLHILEESVLGEVFVDKVRLFWPEFTWGKFAGFNTILLSLEILSIILYEILGGAWVVFPLSLCFERVFNGIYHLWETINTRKFSSGLLSSVIFWILGYFVIRYAIVPGNIGTSEWITSAAIGLVVALAMTSMLAWGAMRIKKGNFESIFPNKTSQISGPRHPHPPSGR